MRVMTFNLRADNVLDIRNRWKRRASLVYDVISQYDCDIIGLQEVTKQMESELEEYTKAYYKTGEGRTKRLFMEKNPLLIKKKFSVIEDNTFWLSKTPWKKNSTIWYSLFPRICTGAICETEDGKRVRIYNTHLDCLLPHAREFGLQVILDHICDEQAKEYLPCILMGDFNAKPNSKLIQRLRNGKYVGKRFIAVQEINPELYKKTTMGSFKGRDEGRHIDYIFVTEEFKVERMEIVKYSKDGKYPSDHYPLVAELKL